jgi:hypothetical protein
MGNLGRPLRHQVIVAYQLQDIDIDKVEGAVTYRVVLCTEDGPVELPLKGETRLDTMYGRLQSFPAKPTFDDFVEELYKVCDEGFSTQKVDAT